MPTFTIQVPDGRKVTAQANDEAQVLAGVKDWYAKNPAQAAQAAAPAQPAPAPDVGQQLTDATGATINGIVNGIPIVGPLAQGATDILGGGIAQLTGGNFNDYVKHQQDVRAGYAERAPAASLAGNVGGALATFGGLGAVPATAEALGLTGAKTLPRVVNSVLSTQAIGTADNMARGEKPVDATVNAVLPALAGGGGGVLAGEAVKALGGKIAKTLTESAQRKITSEAIKGAPSAEELKSAGSQLFEKAFAGNIPAISDTAMMKMVGDVKNAVARYRPNEHTSKEAVGVLQHMMELADAAANTPGVVVDLKDLHILRQTAGDVLQSGTASPTSKSIAGHVVDTLDNFIKNLKPADILGGGDPREAANNLFKAIPTWARASKVGLIENALRQADTYKSGFENGLKQAFLNLMKTADFQRLSQIEKAAVREVAKGTGTQNVAELMGKLGFAFKGSASHNIVGGMGGTFGLTGALTPFVGPAFAFPAAAAITTTAGATGRAIAEHLGRSGADRAAKIFATPGIRKAVQRPNLLAPPSKPLEILIRGGVGF